MKTCAKFIAATLGCFAISTILAGCGPYPPPNQSPTPAAGGVPNGPIEAASGGSVPVERLVGELTLSVKEGDLDVNTNLDVLTSDRLDINASGKIWAGVVLTGENGPRGWDSIDPNPKFPLPGTHPFSLLGKIGTQYFYIGDGSEVNHAIANGRLWLRINDDTPGNGSGAFTAHVGVWRK